MNRATVMAACRRAWGAGDLQRVNGGYQWYARATGQAPWLGYTLAEARAEAEWVLAMTRPYEPGPPDTRPNPLHSLRAEDAAPDTPRRRGRR